MHTVEQNYGALSEKEKRKQMISVYQMTMNKKYREKKTNIKNVNTLYVQKACTIYRG